MKVYKYNDLNKLNQGLFSFKSNNIEVSDIKIVGHGDSTEFYVLTEVGKQKKTRVKKEKKTENTEVKE